MVYYRKYRPQILEEIIGQTHVRQNLLKAFQQGTLAHAYLFCGPRGTGKTSTARILAKMVNCQTPHASTIPCNECISCQAITQGSSLDLIEIDAASNRGIDDIRSLRENIKLAPSQGKKKVYIIDEVHMLTSEAFNALLKTLEEPPSHVLFILATTEPQKIPLTVLSRLQRLDFQLASSDDIRAALKRVIEKENLSVEEEALEMIVAHSEGSFRDSLKLLDQMASSGEKISLSLVEDNLREGSNEEIVQFLSLLAQKDVVAVLSRIKYLQENGYNLKEFTLKLLYSLRALLLSSQGANQIAGDSVGKAQLNNLLTHISPQFKTPEILQLISSFQDVLERMKYISIQPLPLEVAVVEYAQPSLTKNSSISPASFASDEPSTLSPQTMEKLEDAKKEEEKKSQVLHKTEIDQPIDDSAQVLPTSPELTKLLDKWNYILETIKPYNYSLEAMLRQVKVKSCDNGAVILEVPYSFHQRILEAPKSRDLLESVISDVLGKTATVRCAIGQRPLRVEEVANIELAADDEIIRVAAEIFNS